MLHCVKSRHESVFCYDGKDASLPDLRHRKSIRLAVAVPYGEHLVAFGLGGSRRYETSALGQKLTAARPGPSAGAKFDIRTGEVLCDPAYEGLARHNIRVTGSDIEVEI